MSTSPSRKPNIFGFDPFMAVDTTKANLLYGRVDIPSDVRSDSEDAEAEAIKKTAQEVDPQMDRTLPWALLMGGMFKFLYKKAEKEENRRAGRKERGPNDPFPRPIKITPQDWAEAFNIITVSYVKADFLKRPDVVDRKNLAGGGKVDLVLMTQTRGKGGAKTEDYLSPERIGETRKRLRRMERHRLEMAENPRVQDYLQSLRKPAIS